MNKDFSELPLRNGVGIILLNDDNKVFVARRIDNAKKILANASRWC
jgi:putative (di)nucleoside polyphosphate hydrolase